MLIQTPQLPKIRDPGIQIADLYRGRNIDVTLNRYYGKNNEYYLPDHYLFNPLFQPDTRLTSGYPPSCKCSTQKVTKPEVRETASSDHPNQQSGGGRNTPRMQTQQYEQSKECRCEGLYNRFFNPYGNFVDPLSNEVPQCICRGPAQYVYHADCSTCDRMPSDSHDVRFLPSHDFTTFAPPYRNNSLTVSPSQSYDPYKGYLNSPVNPYRKHIPKSNHRLHSSFPYDTVNHYINTRLGNDQSYNCNKCMDVPPTLNHRTVNCPHRDTKYSEFQEVPTDNRSYCFMATNTIRSTAKCRTPYTIKRAHSETTTPDYPFNKIKTNEVCNSEKHFEEKRNADEPMAESNIISISNQNPPNISVEKADSDIKQNLLHHINPELAVENCCGISSFACGCQVSEVCETLEICSSESNDQPTCIRCGEQVDNKVPRCIRCGDRVLNTRERDICCTNIVSETTIDRLPVICKTPCISKKYSKYDNCTISDCEASTCNKELSEGSSSHSCSPHPRIEKICLERKISQIVCSKPCLPNINQDEAVVCPRSCDNLKSSAGSTQNRGMVTIRTKSCPRPEPSTRKRSSKSLEKQESDSCTCALPEASIHCKQCGKRVSGKRKRKRRIRRNKKQKKNESESSSSDASTIRIIKVCNIHGNKKKVKVIKNTRGQPNELEAYSSTSSFENVKNLHKYPSPPVRRSRSFQFEVERSYPDLVANEVDCKELQGKVSSHVRRSNRSRIKRLSGLLNFLNRKRPRNKQKNKTKLRDERIEDCEVPISIEKKHSDSKIKEDYNNRQPPATVRYKENKSISPIPSQNFEKYERDKLSFKLCRRRKPINEDYYYMDENRVRGNHNNNRNPRYTQLRSSCSQYTVPTNSCSRININIPRSRDSHQYPLPAICEESVGNIPISSSPTDSRENLRTDSRGFRNKRRKTCSLTRLAKRKADSRESLPENLNLPQDRYENNDRELNTNDFQSPGESSSTSIINNPPREPVVVRSQDECFEKYLPHSLKVCKKFKVLSGRYSNYEDPRNNEKVPTTYYSYQNNLEKNPDLRDKSESKHINILLVDSSTTHDNNASLNNSFYTNYQHNNEQQSGPNRSANARYDTTVKPVLLERSVVNKAFQDSSAYVKSETDYVSNFKLQHEEFSNKNEKSVLRPNVEQSAVNNMQKNFVEIVDISEQSGSDINRTTLDKTLSRIAENYDVTNESSQTDEIDSDKLEKPREYNVFKEYGIDLENLNKESFNYDISVQHVYDSVNDRENTNVFSFAPHQLIENGETGDHTPEIVEELSSEHLFEHKNQLNREDHFVVPSPHIDNQIEVCPPATENEEYLYCDGTMDLLEEYAINESPIAVESKSQHLLKRILHRLDNISLEDLADRFSGKNQCDKVNLKKPEILFKNNKSHMLKQRIITESKSVHNIKKLPPTSTKLQRSAFPSKSKQFKPKIIQDYRGKLSAFERFQRECTISRNDDKYEERPQSLPNDFNRCEISGRFGENVCLCIEHVENRANKSLEFSRSDRVHNEDEALKIISKYKHAAGAIESGSKPKITICNMANITYDRDEGVDRRRGTFYHHDNERSRSTSIERTSELHNLRRQPSEVYSPIRKRRHTQRMNVDGAEEGEYGKKMRTKFGSFRSKTPSRVSKTENQRSSTAPELNSGDHNIDLKRRKRRDTGYPIEESELPLRRLTGKIGQSNSLSVFDVTRSSYFKDRKSETGMSNRKSKSQTRQSQNDGMSEYRHSRPSRHTVDTRDYSRNFDNDYDYVGGTDDPRNMEKVEFIVENPCLCNLTPSSSRESVQSESLSEIFPGVNYKLTNANNVDIVSMLSKLLGLPYEPPPGIGNEEPAIAEGACACETTCCTCPRPLERKPSVRASRRMTQQEKILSYEEKLQELRREELELKAEMKESDRQAQDELDELNNLKVMIRAERKKLFYEEWRLRNIRSHLEKFHFPESRETSQTKGTYTDKLKQARIESNNREINIQKEREKEEEKERIKQLELELERQLEEEETRKMVKHKKKKKKKVVKLKALPKPGTSISASS